MFGIGGDKQFLSLDWDIHALRVLQWQMGRGTANLLKSLTAQIPAGVDVRDKDSLSRFLRQVLSHERIKTQAVIVDIPRDQAALNSMSLPAVDLSVMAGMVQLQIAKELPFPLNEAVVDFAVAEHDEKATTANVLVAAVRTEVVQFYKSVCEQAGLKLERIGLRPYAIMVAVNEMLGPQALGRVLFVDVGPNMTEIGILREGHMVFSRAASVAIDPSESMDAPGESELSIVTEEDKQEPTDEARVREGTLRRLMVEIRRSAEAYRTTDAGMRFDHIVVSGNSGLERELREQIAESFRVTAVIYNPSSTLRIEEKRGEQMVAFAAAVGLGLGHAAEGGLHFDFLHPKRPIDAAARRLRRLPMIGGIAAAVVAIAAASYYFGIHPKRVRIAELEENIAAAEEKLEKYKEVAKVVRGVEQWEALQPIWPDELLHVIKKLPGSESGYLEDLEFTTDGAIDFQYAARGDEIIKELKDQLRYNLTRETRQGPEPLFELRKSHISDRNDPEYPKESKIHLIPRHILEQKK